jgi:3-oxoadipate enol-lactonase
MPLAHLSSVSLNYELSGLEDGPVLVLAHALGSNLHLWESQVDALGGRYRLLRYDVRGHGQSAVPAGPYTMEMLGMDAVELLNHLAIPRTIFCGMSMSGQTALWLGIHAAERFRGIVVSNAAARFGTEASWNQRIEQVRERGMASLVAGSMARWFTPEFIEEHEELVAPIQIALGTTHAGGYTACCAALRDTDLTAEVSSIKVPTLVIAGTHDPTAPPADSRFLEQQIAGSTYVEVDAAHIANVGDAKHFNRAVLAFAEGL